MPGRPGREPDLPTSKETCQTHHRLRGRTDISNLQEKPYEVKSGRVGGGRWKSVYLAQGESLESSYQRTIARWYASD